MRDDFHRTADQGMFRSRRVELLGGEVVQMPAQTDAHIIRRGVAGKVPGLQYVIAKELKARRACRPAPPATPATGARTST